MTSSYEIDIGYSELLVFLGVLAQSLAWPSAMATDSEQIEAPQLSWGLGFQCKIGSLAHWKPHSLQIMHLIIRLLKPCRARGYMTEEETRMQPSMQPQYPSINRTSVRTGPMKSLRSWGRKPHGL